VTLALAFKGYSSNLRSTLRRWETSGAGRLLLRQYRYDEFVTGAASKSSRLLAELCRRIDEGVIDALVNRAARMAEGAGAAFANLQGGLVQVYAATFLAGLLLIEWYLMAVIR
jgi:hypothetical protein